MSTGEVIPHSKIDGGINLVMEEGAVLLIGFFVIEPVGLSF